MNRKLRAWLRQRAICDAMPERFASEFDKGDLCLALEDLLHAQRIAMLSDDDREVLLTTGMVIGCAHAARIGGELKEEEYRSTLNRMFGVLENY